MTTDEGERRYTMDDPHPADEDLSPELLEFIYGKPDDLRELGPEDFGVDRPDPLFDGERISLSGDEE